MADVSRFSTDPAYFMETCLQIIPKEGRGFVPFRLNPEQVEALKKIWELWKSNEPVRIIVLKARQLGFSTLMEGFIYWFGSNFENITALILGHEREASSNILTMSQRFAMRDARHNLGCMPAMSNVNKNALTFDNPDWRERTERPGLGSTIKVATADNRSAGHSSTLQAFHGTEVARWKRPEILAGVLNALALMPGTFGCLESTGHGASGIFYEIWQAAMKGQNEWLPLFFSWKGRPEYRKKLPPGYVFEPTPYEEKLQKEHGLDAQELYWRRLVVSSPACQGQGLPPEDVFREQYPLTPEEAFITSGRTYFDMTSIVLYEQAAAKMPFKVGHVTIPDGPDGEKAQKPRRGTRPAATFVDVAGGLLRIWKMPQPGRDYVIGADVSAGIKGCDFSAAYVMDRVTGEFVARYRGIVDPNRFTTDLVALAWFYNEAFLAAEANNIGAIVARGVAAVYVRCCYHISLETSEREFDPERPGWYTTNTNRKHMFAYARQALLDRDVQIWCEDFLSECHHFIVPEGTDGQNREGAPRAERRQHDDCILAGTITLWVNNVEIAGPIRRPKIETLNPSSWRHAVVADEVSRERGDKPRARNLLYDESESQAD